MKKVLSTILLAALILTMSVATFAEGGLNDNEKVMLEWAKAEYETMTAGVYVKLPADLVAAAENYLSIEGIDLTEAQCAAAETQVNALKAYLKANLTVADGVTTLQVSDVKKEVYDGILDIYQKLAAAIDASIIVMNNRTYEGRIVIQSNSVKAARTVVVKGVETGAGVDMTFVVVASAAVLVALATAAFVLTKKKGKENA